jgi:pimeloyl-ACP methyl ester carboxylesterase
MHTIVYHRPAKTPKPPSGRFAAVFIHGIFSNHDGAFNTMMQAFASDPQFDPWDLAWFDYHFHQEMPTSGQRLSQALTAHFAGWAAQDTVVLICHSMGGLVARLAALRGGIPFVKKIIMLGTPNFGAVRTSKMAICAQAVMAGTKRLFGAFTRQRGVLDLTQVTKVFKDQFKGQAVQNTDPIEYVTIPGLFFNETRGLFESGDWGEWKGRKNWFAPLRVGLEIWNTYLPLWKIGMEVPHDGIVEESSNRLIPAPGILGYVSEKTSQIDYPEQFSAHTYVHVIHEACRELTHITLQHDKDIIELVAEISIAPTLDQWYAGVLASGKYRALTLRPRFHKPAPAPHATCG